MLFGFLLLNLQHFNTQLICFSHIQLLVTLWIVALQAPLSIGFSRQEYWNGLSFPPPGDLTDPGIKPTSLMSPALAGGFFTTSTTWEALAWFYFCTSHCEDRTVMSVLTNCLVLFSLKVTPNSCCLVANLCLSVLTPLGIVFC